MMPRLEKFDRSKIKLESVDHPDAKPERLVSLEVLLEIDDCPERRHEKVASPKRNSKKTTGKRVRKEGNSQDEFPVRYGLFCHNCYRCLIENNVLILDYITCSRCPTRFCGRCLLNRYGEDLKQELGESVRWVCPRCRGGCGAGCIGTCCNCSACRRMLGLQPTGRLPQFARSAGFNNVHDYLVHLATNESAAAIASRKKGRGWTSVDSCLTTVVNIPAWANRGNRSTRFSAKNLQWGKRPGEVSAGELRKQTRSTISQAPVGQLPLLQNFLRSAQDIGRKLQVIIRVIQNLVREEIQKKGADFQTEDHFCTVEAMKDMFLESQSENQRLAPEQTENKCLPLLKSILSLSQEIRQKVQVITEVVHRHTAMPSRSHFPQVSNFLLLGMIFIRLSLKQVNYKLSISAE